MSLFSKDRKRCAACGSPLQQIRLKAVPGGSGETQIEFLNFPVRECTEDHERWEAYPDFNPEFLHELFSGNCIPFAARAGWLRRKLACSRCATHLTGIEKKPEVVECDVRTRRADFRFRLSKGMFTCPKCGLSQLDHAQSEYGGEIVDAMIDAFESAGIKRL